MVEELLRKVLLTKQEEPKRYFTGFAEKAKWELKVRPRPQEGTQLIRPNTIEMTFYIAKKDCL